MDRVLALAHASCGHVVCVLTDGTSAPHRALATELLRVLHAAGHTRLRVRSLDGIAAKRGMVDAHLDACQQCKLTEAHTAHPVVQAAAHAQANRSARPIAKDPTDA